MCLEAKGYMFAGALLSAATNLLFALLAQVGASVPLLIGVVAMDNLSGGLAAAAFVAINRRHLTAVQMILWEESVPAELTDTVEANC